ncbi:hypothetical protein E5082_19295 [Streptomyces griseoluteus]|uniref:UL36 very large tegument protein n=1 Tax=Streptomyces griseoluteus TaxID=29306 RepID=A0A4Z1DI51_STRGP|nr:hypothetical protein [Streptomyces griseoluteus]TGN82545.1 hypothetical protein E5082_19295 [Streptomyces griseoluteus]GHF08611.1 hypothetical protein GCM10017776_27620 [Streptomyces griseoluteus]
MAEQLTAVAGEFGFYLDGLLSRLDQDAGWCGVFRHRDPDGMRACREGREVPPWDVVDALLRDLAAAYGTAPALAERERARALHTAALVAYDARPGAQDTLTRRLHATLRERHEADEREAALAHRLAGARTEAEAEALRVDLAWARDARHRATARCAELRDRLSRMDRSAPPAARVPGQGAPGRTSRPATSALAPDGPAEAAARAPEQAEGHPAAEATPSKPRKRRRGSARFAGLDDEAPVSLVLPGTPQATPGLRGARFAGAEAEAEAGGQGTAVPVPHPDDHRAVTQAVAQLAALRAAGRSGEAYTLLAEAARWPAVRLPLLADALTHADWTTLRWEAAALPPDQVVTTAQVLTAAGHPEEAHRLLREGAARPPEETGAAVARLQEEGRIRDARTLLDASLRTRTPEDAARLAAPDPDRLTPLLLEAARQVSEDHHRALLHALRAAGTTP